MPGRMAEDMPDRMPEDMPDKMPEDMSDRMPEDLPVTKRIDVMVGITRSKVIHLSFFYSIHHWGISFGTAGMKIRFDVPRLQAFRFVMGVPQARWMAENMENPMKTDDLGVPQFLETSL